MRAFAREAAFWLVHRKDSFYHYVGFVVIRYDPHISWLPWAPLRIPTAMADKLDTEASPSRSPTPDASISRTSRARFIIGTAYRTVVQHVRKHVGVGIVCAVAYFDPYVLCIPRSRNPQFVDAHAFRQRELERRSSSRLQFWISTNAFCASYGWPWCYSSAGVFYRYYSH